MGKTISVILKYIFVFTLLLNCHSVYDAGQINFHFNLCAIFTLTLICVLEFSKLKVKDLAIIQIYCLYQIPIIIYSLTISDYVFTYILKYLIFVILLIMILSADKSFDKDLVRIYLNLIYILSVISLFFYLFATVFKVIQPTGMYYLKWSPARFVRNYLGLYFEVSGGHVFSYKNSSIFAESTIFSALLGLALDFELFFEINKKHKVRRVIIYCITLLSTFSTTGYIVLAMCSFGIFLNYYNRNSKKFLTRNFLRIIVIVIGFFTFSIAMYAYNYKKYGIGESFLVRYDDYRVAFCAFLNNPIFGEGFGNVTYTLKYMSKERIATKNLGQSSDFAYLLGSGGVYFNLIYTIGFAGLVKKDKLVSNKIMFIVILLVIFITTRIGATLLFLSFISMGIMYIFGRINECKINL